ncbi:hypothetical protein J4405_05525 [Candidatus Woesearchaeota archaeon]|nr:hypothetical protein [Candidatus Woesearchaeota archaeon]
MNEIFGIIDYAIEQYKRLGKLNPNNPLLSYADLNENGFTQDREQVAIFNTLFGDIEVGRGYGWIEYGVELKTAADNLERRRECLRLLRSFRPSVDSLLN